MKVNSSVKYIFPVPIIYIFCSKRLVGEFGDHFEGDMILTDEQLDALSSPERNGIISPTVRWPNKTVIYEIGAEFVSTLDRDSFVRGMKAIESVSCIKFRPRTNEKDYVRITVRL